MSPRVVDEDMGNLGTDLLVEVFDKKNHRKLLTLFSKTEDCGIFQSANDSKKAEQFIHTVAKQSSQSKKYSEDVIDGVWICIEYALRALRMPITGKFELGQVFELCQHLANAKEWERWFPKYIPKWIKQ